jgi:hypothetical protein
MGHTVEYAALQRKGPIRQRGRVALLFLADSGGGMTPEKETELFVKLDMLLGAVGRLDSKVGALAEDVAEIKGRLSIMPQPPEFYELRGRVEEISRRLPTAIAYAPPPGGGRREPAE